MWGLILALFTGRQLKRLSEDIERAENQCERDLHSMKRVLLEQVKGEPAEHFAAWGLDKNKLLREAGLDGTPSVCGIKFYSSIGRKGGGR